MHQFTTLRFLSPLHPSLSPLLFNPRRRPFSLCTVFSSLPKKQRNSPPSSSSSSSSSSLSHRSKFKSSLTERKKGQKPTSMEETEPVGFNKRRAEGRDKSDLPKTLQLKVRKLNPVNTICYVQLLGTGLDTQDTSPSVLLFFDKQRFIFNAGEGLQRFCTEHKIKLSKVDHIFLTRVSSETAGGLPGLLLTLAGMGDQGMSVKLWGPSDFKYLVDAMKSFIPNAAMVHSQRFGPSLDGEGIGVPDPKKFSEPIDLVNDELVKISAILLRPSVSNDTTVSESNETPLSHCTNGKAQGALKPGDLSVIYVCELPEIKGKFDPEKAKKLGLKAGPKYRELQLGKSVKSDRLDIMVHPSDVLGPSIPGPIVVLVDCPTVSHLQDLLTVESLTKYYKDCSSDLSENKNAQMVNCVIHLSPSYVRNTPDYQRLMERFGGVQHIMAGHEPRNIEIPVLKSSARIAARLNYLCPQFFPAPGFWSLQSLNNLALSSTSLSEGVQVTSAENLLKFHLRPYANLGFDRSCIPRSTTSEEIIDDLLEEIPEIVDASHKVCQLSSQNYNTLREEPWLCDNELPSCLENVRREDMEIVLLGTGSSQPSKYRNVSSIYINLFSKGGLLFDCGEGTLGQLKRRFGVEGADNAVRSLRCIWISHIHADHHTGLARVLALRRDLVKGVPHEPLLVIGPGQLKRFLNAYQRLEELDMQFIDCRHTTQASWDAFESALGSNTDNSSLTTHQDVDKTLFAKGTPMQSVWKRPGSLVDHQDAFPMLNKLKEMLEDSGLERLISVPVVHCPQAFGVVLKAGERINDTGKFIPGWKIAYSGDTRPCPALIEASLGATVLIHEATFEDGMVDEAVARNHSTTKEAIEVGEKAGVYRIILTHFSQRYPKIPVFEESHMHNTCIGFDLMSINLADLPLLPRVLPFLKLLFRNEMVLDDSDDVSEAAVGVFR